MLSSYILPNNLSQILCQRPKFCPYHVLCYQVVEYLQTFKNSYNHQAPHNHFFCRGYEELDSCLVFSFCLQLTITHDKFIKDGIREQAVVSKLAGKLINNALKDCCELLVAFFIFAIAWSVFGFDRWEECLCSLKDLQKFICYHFLV